MHQLQFWGVRGSMPVGGASTVRYGGHTPCLSIQTGEKSHVVFDAGTGIHQFQQTLAQNEGGFHFHILFTHYHLDHIIGLPFFRPLFEERNRFTFYGYPYDFQSVDDIVHKILAPPWFPIALSDVPAQQEFVDLKDGQIEIDGVSIETVQLEHPQGVAAFRIGGSERAAVLATDYERGVDPDRDRALDTLAADVDVLIHDSQYTPDEYEAAHRGWGHSTWEMATQAASASAAKELILMSHDPDRSDTAVDEMLELARSKHPHVHAAFEGMSIEL